MPRSSGANTLSRRPPPLPRPQLPWSLTSGDPHPSPPPWPPLLALSPAALVFTGRPHCPSPRVPRSNLSAITEPSNGNLPLIYHISSSDIQIRFPLSVWIAAIPFYGLDSSFLVLCLRAVVYYDLPIWQWISLKPESLPLPSSVPRAAGRSVRAW